MVAPQPGQGLAVQSAPIVEIRAQDFLDPAQFLFGRRPVGQVEQALRPEAADLDDQLPVQRRAGMECNELEGDVHRQLDESQGCPRRLILCRREKLPDHLRRSIARFGRGHAPDLGMGAQFREQLRRRAALPFDPLDLSFEVRAGVELVEQPANGRLGVRVERLGAVRRVGELASGEVAAEGAGGHVEQAPPFGFAERGQPVRPEMRSRRPRHERGSSSGRCSSNLRQVPATASSSWATAWRSLSGKWTSCRQRTSQGFSIA